MGEVDETVREFLVESCEDLDQLEQDMASPESEPGSKELLSSIFRTIHTIKGTSGFPAFGRLERLAHRGENPFSELRDGVRGIDQETADALLSIVDYIRTTMESMEKTGQEGDVDTNSIITRIEIIQGKTESATKPVAEQAPYETEETPTEVLFMTNVSDGKGETSMGESTGVSSMTNVSDKKGQASMDVEALAAQAETKPEPTPAKSVQPTGAVVAAANSKKDTKSVDHPINDYRRSATESSIHVDVDLLDVLMHEVFELALMRNQVVRQTGNMSDMNLVRSSQRLSIVAAKLQKGIMKARMQPIGYLWSKMPCMVRDLAKQTGKKVKLVMIGGDTKLDHSLLEAIKNPLTHMVHNAVDHGVESPEERKAVGKDPEGIITMKAYHVGGRIVVGIINGDAGIDPVAAANKVLDRGLVTSAQLQDMSGRDIFNMLSLPGSPTAKKVSNISEREVGTDVVKTSVEAIDGTVDVESELGHGSTQRVRIPLTLVTQPSLTVESHEELYAIPQVSLLELVTLDFSHKGTSMECVNVSPMYRLRGTLLPLIRPSHVLHPKEIERRDEETNGVIVVLQGDDQRFGLMVGKVIDNEEIVVKPLPSKLKSVGLYVGTTLLDDERVILILDIGAMTRRSLAGVLTQTAREAQAAAGAAQTQVSDVTGQALVVGIGDGRHVAIPLTAVTRLEHVNAEKAGRVGGREVIQYHGQILPTVRLDRLLGVMDREEPKDSQVMVYNRGDRSVAMVAYKILDTASDDKRKHSTVEDRGLLGSVVLRNRIAGLLDVGQTVRAAGPIFFDEIDDLNTELELGSRLDMVGA